MALRLFKSGAKEYEKHLYNDSQVLCSKDRMYVWEPHQKIELPEEWLDKIRKEFIGEYMGIKFYSVDGEVLRDEIDDDFCSGGNNGRYKYTPEDEIWCENKTATDIMDVFVHEFVEMIQMIGNGKNYSDAHDFANKYEVYARRHRDLKTFKDFTDFMDEFYLGNEKFKSLPKPD